jgi:hypothetical protein
MLKRNLGDALRARTTHRRKMELLLKVLTHNLMIIRRHNRGSQQSRSDPLSGSKPDRPDDRRAVQVGARVAPQQSSILRVDETNIPESLEAGTFPASNHQPAQKT